MQRMFRWIGLFIVVGLSMSVSAPVAAQGDFTPEEEAALDTVYGALESILAFDSYAADITQVMQQTMVMSGQGMTVNYTQSIESEGEVLYVRGTGDVLDARSLDLTQNIMQEISGMGQDQNMDIGPNRVRLITVGGRIYLRLDVPPELAGLMPEGWIDVTEGANMFPGLEMFNLEGILQMGQAMSLQYLDESFEAVTGIEILEPETVDGQTLTRYRVTIDASLLMELIGTEALAEMFNPGQAGGLDVDAYIRAMYENSNAKYVLEITLDEAGVPVSFSERTLNDADVSSGFSDPAMAGAEVRLLQDIMQTYTFSNINAPLSITAPEIAE